MIQRILTDPRELSFVETTGCGNLSNAMKMESVGASMHSTDNPTTAVKLKDAPTVVSKKIKKKKT